MSDVVQCYVYAGVAGLRQLEYATSTSGPWTAVTVAGYQHFGGYLAALSAALQAAGVDYVLDYDPASDRVTFERQSGTAYAFRLESDSMADLLGLSSTVLDVVASSTAGDLPPAGVVPIESREHQDPAPAMRPNLKRGRFGLSHAVPFGRGIDVGIDVVVAASHLERLTAGPCAMGRLRFGPWGAAAAYSAAEQGGYDDGTATSRTAPRIDGDTVYSEIVLQYDLHIATEPTRTDDGFWLALERGYSLALYAKIEGVPVVWCEFDPGWVDANRSTEARLWVSPDMRIEGSIGRLAGVSGGALSSDGFGILDPDNDTGLFGRPARRATLVERWADSSTVIAVDSVSGWPSSGAVYLGKEWVQYSGTDGGTNTFTGLTRAAGAGDDLVNPVYEYSPSGGLTPFATVADRPYVWAGRVVELWGHLVDSFGRPVGSAWDDDSCRMLHLGEVEGPPAYGSGIWRLTIGSLERRLTRKVGTEASVRLFSLGQNQSPWVIVHDDDVVEVAAEFDGGPTVSTTVTPASDLTSLIIASDGEYHLFELSFLIGALFAAGWALSDGSDTAGSKFMPSASAHYNGEDGTVDVFVQDWQFTSLIDDVRYILTGNGSNGAPYWLQTPLVIDGGDLSQDGTRKYGTFPLMPSRRSDALFVEPPTAAFGGTLPSAGPLIVETDETEVIEYAGIIDASFLGVLALYGVTRRLYGTKAADLLQPGEARTATLLTGPLGVQVATMIQSSGMGLRGTYDTEAAAVGYGISDAYTVGDWSQYLQLDQPVLLSGRASLEDVFGDVLALFQRAIAPVRVGRRLKLGMVPTVPLQGASQVQIRDSDLSLSTVPDGTGAASGPNIVRLSAREIPGLDEPPDLTFIAADSVVARGGQEASLVAPFPALGTLASQVLAAALAQGESLVVYALRLGPGRDILLGAIADVQLTHRAVWDAARDRAGLEATAIVVRVERSLAGEVAVQIAVSQHGATGTLCPAPAITSVSSNDLTVAAVEFTSGAAMWEVGSTVIVYQAGVASRRATATVDAVAGYVVTLNAAPGWLVTAVSEGGCYLTYPRDDAAGLTLQQEAHVHFSDGTYWG